MKATVVLLPGLVALGLLPTPTLRAAGPGPSTPVRGGRYDVRVIKDVLYCQGADADPAKHRLDLYLPRGKKEFPVLIFVHGGGWQGGDKKDFARVGQLFGANGIGVVVVNYRLTPKVKHPAHAHDVARAFAWTKHHIARYGGRPDQLFLGGHSAGGHLAALLATDASYLGAEKCSPADVKGVIPISGVYVIRPISWLPRVFGNDEAACKKASPLEHVAGKHPPFLIVYADHDFRFCDWMSEEMGKKLRACKCEAATLKIAGRDHTSILTRAAADEDDPLARAMLRFIARHAGLKLTPKGGAARR